MTKGRVYDVAAKIIPARKPKKHDPGDYGDHVPNDYGSRTPVIEDDPEWKGFSPIEWMRINTTDPRKPFR